ncbi:MAG: pyridoxamine 5'-phosphate oxidase family protein [Eubacteriaceae bacterium]|nr:pyridoxamine 5'-phosphate oxidase family protein [Eubacteriaceae bacterium]
MEPEKMRRRTREITDRNEIEEILAGEKICHLSMCDDGQPYVIPMLYVYKDGYFYFHCAEVGMKLDILDRNEKVCIEVEKTDPDDIVKNVNTPCMWGLPYKSVVAFGTAEVSDDNDIKPGIMDMLVEKVKPEGYVHSRDKYLEKRMKGSRLIIAKVTSMTGKKWNGVK